MHAVARRALAIAVLLTLLLPPATAGHGMDRLEGDGFVQLQRANGGPLVVAQGQAASELVLDAVDHTDAPVTVVLADDLDAWLEAVPAKDRVVVHVTGTPSGPVARDLTSELVAPRATDALWDGDGTGLFVDDVGGPHPAGRALAEAGYRPVVLDLGDGPRDEAAAHAVRSRIADAVRDDGLSFHSLHGEILGDDASDPDEPVPPATDDGGIGDLVLSPSFLMSVTLLGAAAGILGRFLFGGVKHVTPENALDNESRAALYETIQTEPGIHLRELARSQDMNVTSASWHIKKLEDVGLIRSKKLEGYKVFYPSDGGREAQRIGVAMNALRNDNARALLRHIADRPGCYQREIADAMDLNHATVRWHLDKLKSVDLVTEVPLSHVTQYYVSAEGFHALQVVRERNGGDGDGEFEPDEEARAGAGQAS